MRVSKKLQINNCADGRRQRRAPAVGVISTRGQRMVSNEGTLPCTVAGCLRAFKTKGLLARHMKSIHSALAVAEHSRTPPTVQVAIVKPAHPEPVVLGACRWRLGVGGWNNPLVVGAGHMTGPVNRNPLQLIGDEECGQQGYSLRRRPGRVEMGGCRSRCQLHECKSPGLYFRAVTLAV